MEVLPQIYDGAIDEIITGIIILRISAPQISAVRAEESVQMKGKRRAGRDGGGRGRERAREREREGGGRGRGEREGVRKRNGNC